MLEASHPAVIDPYDAPVSVSLTPSKQRACIGPTPQKDGQVLGMFDGLSSRADTKTPSKRKALLDRSGNELATPIKHSIQQHGSAAEGEGGLSSTATKRVTPNARLTPSMQRILRSCTPTSRNSVRKLRYDDTPAFLRRDSQRTVPTSESKNDPAAGDLDVSWSPVPARKQYKPLGRSLSSMIKDIRNMEDERLDEEMDIMREMEGGGPPAPRFPKPPRVLVEDSQHGEMPLGPDRGIESEDELASQQREGIGKDGKPMRIWKKKGQKRTTRKSNMRPNMAKWKPEPKWKGDGEEEDEGDENENVQSGAKRVEDQKNSDMEDDTGFSDNDEDGEDSEEDSENPRAQKGKKKVDTEAEQSKTNILTTAKRKISATAHANFRALKLRSKNPKGKKGGRFGRR